MDSAGALSPPQAFMTLSSMPDWTIFILAFAWLATLPLIAVEFLEANRLDRGH